MGTSNLEIAFKQRSGRWFLLLPWLAACTSDTVDLGGAEATQGLGRGSRCTDSAVIGEAVLVTNQAELDALAGCEEVSGDLVVDVFDGADLRPLASLRAVGGTFTLGAYPRPEGSEFWDFYQSRALKEQVDQIVAAGYLPSLEGVEALERVANLDIEHVAAPNLAAFSNLRNVGMHQAGEFGGILRIEDASNLSNLSGLENLRGVSVIHFNDNAKLESLAGLVLGAGPVDVNIINSPLLTDIEALSAQTSFTFLALQGLGIRNLDALRSLYSMDGSIYVVGNEQLENVDQVSRLSQVATFSVQFNPKLVRFPAMSNLKRLEGMLITDNASLTALALELPASPTDFNIGTIDVYESPGFFAISNNSSLQSITLAAGLTSAGYLAIERNAALTSIDLGSLSSLGSVSIQDNANLSQLGLGSLQTVDSLDVIDNPLLSTAPLDAVRSFEMSLSGNASDAAAP